MPGQAHPNRYSWVAFVLAAWVGTAFIAKVGDPYIPEEANPALLEDHRVFIRQAASQQVRWREPSEAAFLEASRLDRPVLLMIGTGWSRLGDSFDRMFRNPRIAEAMNQGFVCVRVDELHDPAWKASLLPLYRAVEGADTGFRLLVLSGQGELITRVGVDGARLINEQRFIDFLKQARQVYAQRSETEMEQERQREQFLLMGGEQQASPDIAPKAERLARASLSGRYDFREAGSARLTPQIYLLLEETGHHQKVDEILGRLIRSKAADPVFGGFFQFSVDNQWQQSSYVHVATADADMLELMARRLSATDDPLVRWMYDRSFDHLVRWANSDSAPGFTAQKVGVYNRAEGYSVPPRDIGRWLQSDAGFARNRFLLDVARNEQMVPVLTGTEWSESDLSKATAVASVLTRRLSQEKQFSGGLALTWVRAAIVRSLLTSSALDGNLDHRTASLAAWEAFRSSVSVGRDDVYGQTALGMPFLPGGLIDYLGFADAAFAAYRLTGDLRYREHGVRVLERALFLFSPSDGVLVERLQCDLGALEPRFTGMDLGDGARRGQGGLALDLIARYAATESDPARRMRLRTFGSQLAASIAKPADLAPVGTEGVLRGFLAWQIDAVLIVVGDEPLPGGTWPLSVVRGEGGLERGFYLVTSGQRGPVMTAEEAALAVSRVRRSVGLDSGMADGS